ncbi:hypothetical protein BJ988_004983 [Nocardioides panzhihuensis]|uniref:Peptidase M1 membrane alanine aminopeptidase domain-containing protein n=1 Tax=Nocardioides panzhihuensis TaxID=860243 RepID=A0A7Z0DR93_9ACTN|nr:hypothetical protein [Nocardioides panzhihuensis]
MRIDQGAGRLRRAAVAMFVLGVVGSASVLAAPSAVAAPNDGVGESSRTRYVLDEKARTVRVKSEITVTNQQPSTATTYYFLTGHAIPIPAGAKKIKATSNGSKLGVSTEKIKGTGLEVASVSFANLYYGKSRTITWTYELPSAPIRAKRNHIRIGEGYAVFPVIGVGDDDSVTVEVVLPKSMEFSTSVPGFKKKDKGNKTTWKATGGFIEGGVSARDPKVYDEEKMAVGDTDVALQSFPGDKEWRDFAKKQVRAGLPVLEKTIGQEWPGGLDTIREDVSSEALGYAWFDSDADEIVVSEDLDAAVLYHEMTHAWINPDTVRGRWLSEGLTEMVAQRVTKEVGAKGQSYDKVKRRSKDAFPLALWDAGTGSDVERSDAYGYPASVIAVSAIVGDLSDKQLTALLSDVYRGRTAYTNASDGDDPRPGDWTTFLDLAVKHGASPEKAEKALRTWVLHRSDASDLEVHAAARKTYEALDRANGDWVPPAGVRDPMSFWQFQSAEAVMEMVEGTNKDAVAVQDAAEAAGIPVPSAVEKAYETANVTSEYQALATMLPKAAEATKSVGAAGAAVDGTQNPITELGELVLLLDVGAASARADLDDGHLDDASATAGGVRDRAKWAFWVGLVALVALAGVGYAAFRVLRSPWARGRRVARRQRRANRKAFLAQVKQTKKAGAPWDRPAPPGPPGGPPPSVGGELFGVQRGPDGPRGVEQPRRDDLGVQVEQREEFRRFLRDPSADQE